jgi:hypothetical protein
MFEHPRNKLDLFSELQSSKVILVNTAKGLLKSGTEPFGRYFLARLLQATEERMFLERGSRNPVFAYIDEASDYIAEDENVEDLIDKARKQNVALIFANQRRSQITSPTVRDALSRAAIQCEGRASSEGGTPKWHISVGKSDPVSVKVPNVRIQDMPRMSAREFATVMQDMRSRYTVAAAYFSVAPYTSLQEPPNPRPKFRGEPPAGDSDDPTKWG